MIINEGDNLDLDVLSPSDGLSYIAFVHQQIDSLKITLANPDKSAEVEFWIETAATSCDLGY